MKVKVRIDPAVRQLLAETPARIERRLVRAARKELRRMAAEQFAITSAAYNATTRNDL